MKKNILSLVLLFFVSGVYCQIDRKLAGSDHYIQAAAGTVFYSGDIRSNASNWSAFNRWNWAYPRPIFSLGYKNMFHKSWSAKASASYLQLAGSEENLKTQYDNIRSFKSSMFEVGANIEFNFVNGFLTDELIHQAYVFTGVGMVFGVDVVFKGSLYDAEYNPNPDPAFFFPVGVGYQINFDRLSLGLEVFGQITTTDYLDGFDYKKSKYNDYLLGTQFIVSYRISKDCKTCHFNL